MSREEFCNERPYNYTPYYCHLCKIYCASPINLQTHFLGVKHKSVENVLKSHGIVKPLSSAGEPIKPLESLPDYVQTEPERDLGRTLKEQLDSCQDSEPAIGLQYITEYQINEYPLYECSLCGCQTRLSNMFMHVLGVKHKLAYLKKHYPEMSDVKGKGASFNKKLKELAGKVEKLEGRKEIKVTKDPPAPRDHGYSTQLSYSLVTWFAEDDIDIEMKKEKETNKEKENLTLEKKETAKKAEEASKDAEAKTQCNSSSKSEKSEKQQDQNTEQQKIVEKQQDQNTEEQKAEKQQDQNTEEQKVAEKQQDQQGFEILNEDDASFILKIIQKLTNALVMYRYISEKRNSLEPSQEEGFDDQLEQFNITSVQIDDFSGEHPLIQRSCDNEEANLKVKSTFKRKASHLNTNPSKGNAKSCKLGTFVSSFKEVPNEQSSPDADTQDADAKMQESPSQKRAPSAIAERKNLPSSDKHLSNPTSDKRSSSQSQSAASSTVCPGPITSENDVIAEFFNSIRNMEVHEVAVTLHKIAASNPAFHGMDVQNVINILTRSGNLKPENTSSAR
ncbi:uncharacterized protein DDB_G0286299-like isoform X2 [Tiliqua scincoides]|uniref:uncharacterized protein DDB_G0286299-like isoform X2 n=1 Tax=Tiliqua scincoides TaxID=71010 RepID=UPI003462060A